MLRKCLSLLLILCLLIPCAAAEEAASPVELPTVPDDLAVLGGDLYAATYDGLYRQTNEGWFLFDMSGVDGSLLRIAADGDTLYLLTRSYMMDESSETPPCQLFSITLQADGTPGPITELYSLDFDLADDWPQVCGMTVFDGSLYVLLYDYLSSDWGKNLLFRIDLSTGALTRVTQDYIQALVATADGLVGLYWNQAEAYKDNEIIMPELASIDASTGEHTTLLTLEAVDASGLAHDPATGYTYLTYSNRLMRFDSAFAQGELCGYLAPGYASNGSCTVSGDRYYYANWTNDGDYIGSATVDPALLPSRVLRILGSYTDDAILKGFAREHQEIALELVNTYQSGAEAISQAMREKNPVDVYSLYLSTGDYIALRDKGYTADLSGSAVLTDAVAAMYPNMTAPLYKDGKLTAIPMNTYSSAMGYYPAALEKVGLTADDLPTSIEGLLDFIVLWNDEYAEEYPEIKLFGDSYSLYDQLIQLVFAQRIVECAATGDQLTFNTPEIRALLNRLEQLKPQLEDMSMEQEADGSYIYWGPFGENGEPTVFFTTYASILPERYGHSDWDATPHMFSLTEGGERCASLEMAVSFINPASENIDLAIQWLEYYVQHMHQVDRMVLDPSVNEPYEYEYYQENLKNIQESITMYEQFLAESEEADKPMWEENLSWLREELASIEESRWAVSEEDIAAYREIAPKLVLVTSNIFSGADNEAAKLLQRYTDGQMSADQFIREFDRVVTMMQMESY